MDRKIGFAILAVLALILIVGLAGLDGYCPGRGTGWGYGMMGWGMGWMWILFLVILIVVAFLLFSGNKEEKGRALQILDERYARGEINKDQYEEMKRTLGL